MTGYKKQDITLVTFNPPADEPRDTVTISFNPADLPYLTEIDTSLLITNLMLRDVSERDEEIDPEVLYYTVQVMALYNPVDPAYFEFAEISVFYSSIDRFYRYTTGTFSTKQAAYEELNRLLRLGYPNDIFVKKVYRNDSGR
jgi:hypothetical protein